MKTRSPQVRFPQQSRLVSISDAVSCVVACLLGGYLNFLNSYTESLHSNKTAGMWMGLFGSSYVLCSLLSVLISVILIIRVTISFGKVQGYWGGIRGLFVVLVTAGIFMPTVGKSNTFMYQRKANSVVSPALRQFNDSPKAKEMGGPLQIDDFSIKVNYLYKQKSNLIEVRYELNRKIETDSFPQEFSVILNRDDGSAELRKEVQK